MKRVVYETFGNPSEVLKCVEVDALDLAEGQARVDVLRAPINPSDLIQVAGNYGVRPDLPAVAGNEGLGRVREVRGSGLAPGQLVLLPAGQGTWVSEVIADITQLVPLPEGDIDQLCMLAINPATAHLLLTDYVQLQPGDWLIQSAANSAVGTYIVQMAKARGLKVACVVRRESAAGPLRDLGADAVLVDGPDLVKDVREATGGAKIPLALDAVAGTTYGRLAEALAPGGTLVSYGAMSMAPAEMQAGMLIFRDITARGFWLVNWFSRSSAETRQRAYADLVGQVMRGTLHVPIDRHFTLDEIAEAAAYTAAGERDGKVLLAPNGV